MKVAAVSVPSPTPTLYAVTDPTPRWFDPGGLTTPPCFSAATLSFSFAVRLPLLFVLVRRKTPSAALAWKHATSRFSEVLKFSSSVFSAPPKACFKFVANASNVFGIGSKTKTFPSAAIADANNANKPMFPPTSIIVELLSIRNPCRR